jgi:hypothetical protein
MFLLGPNSCGSPVVAETPLPFGPRNCGQSSAAAVVSANDVVIVNAKDNRIKAKTLFLILEAALRELRILLSITPVLTSAGKAGQV